MSRLIVFSTIAAFVTFLFFAIPAQADEIEPAPEPTAEPAPKADPEPVPEPVPAPAQDDDFARNSLSAQGGLFDPAKGSSGTGIAVQYARKLGKRHHLGPEFEYRDFDGELFGISDIAFKTYHLRALYRVDILTDSIITPYVGIGLGVAINDFDDDKVEAGLAKKYGTPFVSVPSIGVGIGILGLAGVELRLPGLSMLSLFGEARYEYSAQFTQIKGVGDEDLEVDNLGGLGVHGGLRFSF
jgi:hypothetical protein